MDLAIILQQLRREYENGTLYKQGRIKDWQQTEDQYFGRVKKTIRGRFNVPFPIMPGYIDTLQSKIDDPPRLNFVPVEEGDKRATKKVQAAYELVSKREDADWASKDVDNKKLASLYGRAIFKSFGESLPKFNFYHNTVDPYDFYCDPLGGGDLENHRFLGQDNIFKTKADLIFGVKSKLYDPIGVYRIINNIKPNETVNNDNAYQNKANRLNALGLSGSLYNYVADGAIKCIESGTTIDNVRYYVLWSYEYNAILRIQPLVEMFKSGLWWFTSWATHRDSFNFWSKAPADDIRPIAEAIRILANQELDNRQKKNWGQRAYDPEVFPNASELEFRPDGLVQVKGGTSKLFPIGNGIYEFKTPELNGTINLVEWLDNFLGQKTGITPSAQGATSVNTKVGVYYGDLQQVADRLGLYNKSYSRCYSAIGRRFAWALFEHLTEPMAVKMIGEQGVYWDQLKSREVNPEMNILVEGGNAQMQADEVKKKKRFESLLAIKNDPILAPSINRKWMIEQILDNGTYSEEEIRVALDTENDGSSDLLSKAAEAIQQIVEGKQPKLVRAATTAFQQKILDYALDNTDENPDLFKKLIAYAQAHDQIVQENMVRKAMKIRSAQGSSLLRTIPGNPGSSPVEPGQVSDAMPAAAPDNTPTATASRSQMMVPSVWPKN